MTLDDFYAQLPVAPAAARARQILHDLTIHIAEVLAVPPPTRFAPGVDDGQDTLRLPGDEYCTPELLGSVWERLMTPVDRRSQGAHFTPRSVATRVCALAVERLDLSDPDALRVWDPSAGGGAFLLAAARLLERETSLTRPEIVERLYASDIDAVALDVCVASLSLWSGSLTPPNTFCGDALLEIPSSWPSTFDLIVGNPPFLSQLSADTSRTEGRRARLADEYAETATGYVDEAALFVHLTIKRLASPGVGALVLPESLLAARDARPVREIADRTAAIRTLWTADEQSFEASVDVVAPIFVQPRPDTSETRVLLGDATVGICPTPSAGMWAPLLAATRGVPVVQRESGGRVLGELASSTAGFRQHFYGLAGAVHEADDQPGDGALPQLRLVTAGAIEPLRLCWGDRPVKFGGQRWNAPVVELEEIEDEAVRQWFEDRAVPKILIASQTKVIEAVVDPGGTLLPSVPVLSLEPHDPDELWHVAAVVSSPWASAWYAGRAAGSGLSNSAIRVRASELAKLPLPADKTAWGAGADAARRADAAAREDRGDRYQQALRDLAESMGSAYGGVERAVSEWWWERIRMPEHFATEAY